MVDIQSHRGPDADGFFVDGPLAMGMRRLSIIDVAGGDQPIFSEDRSVSVVMNGELFNYVELRQILLQKGHRFATKSDTEILVHMFEEHGAALLPKLNGMFAFALWDKKSRSLLLARDRMGVKPLYYARIGTRWLFASELKSLLTQKYLNTQFDLDALADFLRLGYIPREATPYLGVKKLLPGHYLVIRENYAEERAWWDLASIPPGTLNGNPSTTARLVEEFDDAVKIRMRSDVPVASFLSGGLDSSLITITAQQQSSVTMRTFAMAFEHSEFNELPYASAAAKRAGTQHEELLASVQDAIEKLPMLLWHMDEPMGDSSIIPNYLISRMAAQHVKVCLSGLGGDELFGGYSRYVKPEPGRIRKLFHYAPGVAGTIAPIVDRYSYPWAEELRIASDPALEWRTYLHKLQIFDRSHTRRYRFSGSGARRRNHRNAVGKVSRKRFGNPAAVYRSEYIFTGPDTRCDRPDVDGGVARSSSAFHGLPARPAYSAGSRQAQAKLRRFQNSAQEGAGTTLPGGDSVSSKMGIRHALTQVGETTRPLSPDSKSAGGSRGT